jgi:hypothetical protein
MKKQYHLILLFSTVFLGVFMPSFKVFGQEPTLSAPVGTHAPVVNGSNAIENEDEHRVSACAAPANDNFVNATLLTAGTTLTGQTTCGGTLEAGENLDCNSNAKTTVWYRFVATAATLYVNIWENNLPSNCLGAAVWSTASLPTGNCQALQCQDAVCTATGLFYSFSMELTNLSIGSIYYIQVSCPTKAETTGFQIGVLTTNTNPTIGTITVFNPPPVNACATAVPGCYINSFAPSAATIEASCPGYQFAQPPYPTNIGYPAGGLQFGYVYSICYSFTNLNTSGQIDIQNLLFTCAGNTFWMDYTLYSSACAILSCGNLSNLTVSGVACNTNYTICETFEAACNFDNGLSATNGSNMGIIPFASWPSAAPASCSVLPIKLTDFSIDYKQTSNSVLLDWATATETNNHFFTAEKSVNGNTWTTVATIDSKAPDGNSNQPLYYSATDENPSSGVSYYRLKQTDLDGNFTYSSIVPLSLSNDYAARVFPNPTNGNLTLQYTSQSSEPVQLTIRDISGKVSSNYAINEVQQGVNNFDVVTSTLAPGMYILQVSNQQKTFYLKFVRE